MILWLIRTDHYRLLFRSGVPRAQGGACRQPLQRQGDRAAHPKRRRRGQAACAGLARGAGAGQAAPGLYHRAVLHLHRHGPRRPRRGLRLRRRIHRKHRPRLRRGDGAVRRRGHPHPLRKPLTRRADRARRKMRRRRLRAKSRSTQLSERRICSRSKAVRIGFGFKNAADRCGTHGFWGSLRMFCNATTTSSNRLKSSLYVIAIRTMITEAPTGKSHLTAHSTSITCADCSAAPS